MRVLDIGISQGAVFTGTIEQLASFRDHLTVKLREESVKVISVDLSGKWLSEAARTEESEPQDLIIVWGLEYLSPQESRTYSLRATLDILKHSGPRFAIFCENERYAEHFNDYNAPFYHFCFRIPVCSGSDLTAE
ncbi:MAG: hypothetical protein H6998_19115 [Hahellaceae bacterium]|nr:hypothetical protein [Hahellaceae bacterium]